jgi:hypothetical protein
MPSSVDVEASGVHPPAPTNHQKLSVLARVGAAALIFFGVEAAVFHSGFYASLLHPVSSAGRLQSTLYNELHREIRSPHQVLAVGDSRMSFRPKAAHQHTTGSGYSFATIMVPGTTPRCWYYMLREVDPRRDRYAAILIPVDDYDDDDWEDLSNRDSDLHYLASILRLSDIVDFSSSFSTWATRWEAFRGILLRGWTYQRDFQALLADCPERLNAIKWTREESAQAIYNYVYPERSLKGLSVDYATRTIHYPEGLSPFEREVISANLLRGTTPPTGKRAQYRRKWFGKIVDYYRGSHTRLIVLRAPRGPVVRPDLAVDAPTNSIREMARHGDFLLMNEKVFDELERPEMYGDGVHLNGPGSLRFTQLMADETLRLLGPANAL